MKSLYWRSSSVSSTQLAAVAAVAAIGLFVIEANPDRDRDSQYETKLRAARLAEEMYRAVNLERIALQIPLETELDPAGSGLIGAPHSVIVSNEGHLRSKQTTANPNFAAMFIDMMDEAGVGEGDLVAVNCTGSFPAMNINLYAALEVVGAEAIVISSVGTSTAEGTLTTCATMLAKPIARAPTTNICATFPNIRA